VGREGSLQDHPGVLCADVKCAIGDGVRDRAVVGSSPFAPQQDRSKSFAGIGRALVEALPFRPKSFGEGRLGRRFNIVLSGYTGPKLRRGLLKKPVHAPVCTPKIQCFDDG
jgi:hypothetical protein